MIVWAAGIKAANANAGFGLAINKANQFVVSNTLETSAPDIFALGDCAACTWGERQVPPRAQAAHQQASFLTRLLLARLGKRCLRQASSSIAISVRWSRSAKSAGLGSLMGGLAGRNFFVEGLIAKSMYMALHLDHHRAILGIRNTIILALARLLQRRVSGRLKLH